MLVLVGTSSSLTTRAKPTLYGQPACVHDDPCEILELINCMCMMIPLVFLLGECACWLCPCELHQRDHTAGS